MTRSVSFKDPGYFATSLGYGVPFPLPDADDIYAAYFLSKQNRNNPLADLSGNGLNLSFAGPDFSSGSYPPMGQKNFVVTPFTGVDVNTASGGVGFTLIVIARTDPTLNTVVVDNAQTPLPGMTPDTNRVSLWTNIAGAARGIVWGGGFKEAQTADDPGATGMRMLALSYRDNISDGIRSYSKRSGQATKFTQVSTAATSSTLGVGVFRIGKEIIFGNGSVSHIPLVLFYKRQKTQAELDAIYTALATLMNPYLADYGENTL